MTPPLHRLVEEQAAARPEAQALAGFDGSLTYRELDARATRIARTMAAHGVSEGCFVRIYLPRSIDLITSFLAALKVGAAYVPLEPAYPAERIRFLVNDLNCRMTLTNRELRPGLPDDAAGVICLEDVEREIASCSDAALSIEPGARAAAVVLYTSGSTGNPKGVVLHHRGLVNYVMWERAQYGHGPGDRMLQQCALSFDFALWEIFTALANGGCLVLPRPRLQFEGSYLVDLIQRERVTTLGTSPSLLSLLVDVPGFEGCSSLRRVFAGGEILSGELQRRFFARSAAGLVNIYGPTEATISATHWECRREDASDEVPIGFPAAGARVHLLDEAMRPVSDGSEGEIFLGGPGVGLGYHNRPELDRERFVPDPFATEAGARLYRTGDRGRRLPHGAFAFCGRLDHQVKLRGLRIELEEVESALRQCPGVKACVVSVADHGRENRRLAAYFVRGGAEPCSPASLRHALGRRLPDFMIPSVFVEVERLPLTPNGKIDRHHLPPIDTTSGRAGEGPASETERLIAGIWSSVLGIERPSVTADFFEVGGSSLACLDVAMRIEKRTGIRMPLSLMYVATTIRDQAARLDSGNMEEEGIACVPLGRGPEGRTLVLVGYPGGPLQRYSRLTARLQGVRILGMTSPLALPRPGEESPVRTMAWQQAGALLKAAPDGELVIAGFSTGGLVAIELARRLAELGRQVETVILLDSGTPDAIRQMRERTWSRIARDALALVMERDWPGRRDFLIESVVRVRRRIRLEWERRPRRRPPDPERERGGDALAPVGGHADESRSRADMLYALVKDHKIARYDGRVVLVCAQDLVPIGMRDTTLGWGKVLPGPPEVRTVPGTHNTILEEPHVSQVAGVFREVLDSARPARCPVPG